MDQHGHGPSTRTHLFGSASEAPQRSRDPHMNTHALYLLTKSRSHSGVFPLLWQLPSLLPTKTARAPFDKLRANRGGINARKISLVLSPLRLCLGQASASSGQALSQHRSGIVSSLLVQLRFSETERNRRSKSVVQVVKILQARIDDKWLLNFSRHGFDRFVTIPSDANHNRFAACNPSLFDEFLGDCHCGFPSRFGKNTFGASEQLNSLDDLFIRYGLTPTARIAHYPEDVVAIGRVANGDRLGNGIGLHWRNQIRAFVQSLDHRRTASRLGGIDFRYMRILDQANFFEFFERLGNLGQDSTTGGGHDNMLR